MKNSKSSEDISKPLLTLEINGCKVKVRVDTGADIKAIAADVASRLKLELTPYRDEPLLAVNNSEVKVLGLAPVSIKYNGKTKSMPVAVLPQEYIKQALWGCDSMYGFKIPIDVDNVGLC